MASDALVAAIKQVPAVVAVSVAVAEELDKVHVAVPPVTIAYVTAPVPEPEVLVVKLGVAVYAVPVEAAEVVVAEMVNVACAACETVNERETCVAAEKLELPLWSAVKVQVPVAKIVTVNELTVQTEVVIEAKTTVRDELAVGETVKATSP